MNTWFRTWCSVNDSKDWALGCKVVQAQINSSTKRGLKMSPWTALTGLISISGFHMPQDAQAGRLIRTEAELERCKLDLLTCLAVSIAVPTCTGTIHLGNSHQMKMMTRRCGLMKKLLHTISSITR